MSAGLKDLLFSMRQHPSFQEMLNAVESSPVKPFKPGKTPEAEQEADWKFRSGRQHQHQIWRDFLTDYVPQDGEAKEEKP